VYCLTELNWYRRPTEERLADEAFRSGKSVTKVDVRQEKRSCERSIGDSPPAKRGSIKDTPMNTESVVKVASINCFGYRKSNFNIIKRVENTPCFKMK
jgi:hypothetical protein